MAPTENRLHQHLGKLYHFYVLAEEEQFARAAKRLRISQPALSISIKALEEGLETSLLARTRRGTTLTPQGKRLYHALRGSLSLLSEAQVTSQKQTEAQTIVLRLGTKEPLAIHFWPAFVSWLAGSDPSLLAVAERIDLHVDKSNQRLIDRLREGDLDFLLVPEPNVSGSFTLRRLFSFDYRFFESVSSTPKRPVLLCYGEAIVKTDLRLGDALKKNRAGLRVVTVQSFDAAREMAVRGLGTALLPTWVARDAVNQGLLREVAAQEIGIHASIPVSQAFLCTKSETAKSPERKIISELATQMRKFCADTRFDRS